MRRFRLCALKRRVRFSRGLPYCASNSAPARHAPGSTSVRLSESFSLDESHATPRDCRAMIASTRIAGASSPDSLRLIDLSTIDPTRRIAKGLGCNLTPAKRHWHLRLCARAFLASPWANGSMSVCLGSSAAGGPASESGTSFTAHASAHDPNKPKKIRPIKRTHELPKHTENDSGHSRIVYVRITKMYMECRVTQRYHRSDRMNGAKAFRSYTGNCTKRAKYTCAKPTVP